MARDAFSNQSQWLQDVILNKKTDRERFIQSVLDDILPHDDEDFNLETMIRNAISQEIRNAISEMTIECRIKFNSATKHT